VRAHDYDRPGKPDCAWDDPEATQALVSGLVNDALALLAAVAEVELDAEQAEAVALLALVAGQDVEPDQRPGSWRIARRVAQDRGISVVDPQARHARKTSAHKRDGYKGHLAAEPESGLVTECALTAASVADGPTGVGLLGAEQPGLEVLGDSAYGGGATRVALRAAGHLQTIKPIPLQSAVPGGFTIHDFRIDRSTGMLRCPAGITAPITSSGRVSFARACPSCPLRRRCTTAKGGRASSTCTRTRTSCAPPAAARPPAASSTATGGGGRWWNAPSPGWSPTAAGGCPTAASNATSCGGRSGWPRSTSAGCWPSALPARMPPGSWPEPDHLPAVGARAVPTGHGESSRSAGCRAITETTLTRPGVFSRLLAGDTFWRWRGTHPSLLFTRQLTIVHGVLARGLLAAHVG
jgi:hypothetical protein